MVDFPKFFNTAAELYEVWPSFFVVSGGLIVSTMVSLVAGAWWVRGYKAEAEKAAVVAALKGQIETERAALKGEIAVLLQRFALATEQQKATTEQTNKLASDFAELKSKARTSEVEWNKIQEKAMQLDATIKRTLQANNVVTTTLTYTGQGHTFDWPGKVTSGSE